VGRPGFYGDRLFVILKEQKDVASARTIRDYSQRRQYVYDTLARSALQSQSGIRVALDRFGVKYTPYYLVNAIEVPDNPLLRFWLQSRPEVDRILESPRMRPLPGVTSPLQLGPTDQPPADPAWNLTTIAADKVWRDLGVTGEGVIVGQSDSGVQVDHPEIADRYRGKDSSNDYNWLDPWFETSQPIDRGGHGTHTLGTILGKNVGVAPGATWYACANLSRNLGNPALYLDCMQFMLAPYPQKGDSFKDGRPDLGAHVINNSWGCPDLEGCDPQALVQAVKALTDAGVFVVASAGNDGPSCSTIKEPLALYADAYTVGASNKDGNLVDFSSLGPVTSDGSRRVKPDILAPGAEVLSSVPSNAYETNSGTSMAGPHVVGVVALMWSANPGLIGDIERTRQILNDTATPYAGKLPDCPGASNHPSTAVGYGIVNAYEAVKMAISLKNR
jgi:subtilisin family serine protease